MSFQWPEELQRDEPDPPSGGWIWRAALLLALLGLGWCMVPDRAPEAGIIDSNRAAPLVCR